MIKHVSEMELYIILSTLEKFEHWNRTVFNHEILASEMVLGARSSPILHIGRFFRIITFVHYFTQQTGRAMPKRT